MTARSGATGSSSSRRTTASVPTTSAAAAWDAPTWEWAVGSRTSRMWSRRQARTIPCCSASRRAQRRRLPTRCDTRSISHLVLVQRPRVASSRRRDRPSPLPGGRRSGSLRLGRRYPCLPPDVHPRGTFIPEGSEQQLSSFNQLCSKTVRPDMAARLLEARADTDAAGAAAPRRDHHARPAFTAGRGGAAHLGRQLAAEIPGARFVQLSRRPHPAGRRARLAALPGRAARLHRPRRSGGRGPDLRLAVRARARGPEAGDAGARLVENGAALRRRQDRAHNHVSRIYEKLGAGWRPVALAHEKGFAGSE